MRLFCAVGSEHSAKGTVLADHSGRFECLLKATAIFKRSISTHKQSKKEKHPCQETSVSPCFLSHLCLRRRSRAGVGLGPGPRSERHARLGDE